MGAEEVSRSTVRVPRMMKPSVSPMASAALVTRFTITCWICAASASTGGRSRPRWKRREIFLGMETFIRWTISFTTWLRSWGSTWNCPRPE